MREPLLLGTPSSTCSVGVAESREPASYLNRSMGSVAAASLRVGDLLKQAMAFLETDRKAAWRCLRDASTLLSPDEHDPGINSPSLSMLKPRGLATWQARRTLAYIEANLASKIDIDDLANVVDLSGSHFSRAFKHCIGLSPMEYVVVRRIERAKTMISGTQAPLAQIALACGFADQAHFNKRFRAVVGTSPGRWRRSNAPTAKPASLRTPEVTGAARLRLRPVAEYG